MTKTTGGMHPSPLRKLGLTIIGLIVDFLGTFTVSEVNANYAQEYFPDSSNALPQIEFRIILTK